MGSERGKINSKEKQFSGGNWGHPRPFIKKHTKIEDPLDQEVPRTCGSKKYKKKKEKIRKPFYACPFCGFNIEKTKEERDKDNKRCGYFVWDPYKKFCENCKAFVVDKGCPACKREAWFKADDKTVTTGEYAHINFLGCGFKGRKIIRP